MSILATLSHPRGRRQAYLAVFVLLGGLFAVRALYAQTAQTNFCDSWAKYDAETGQWSGVGTAALVRITDAVIYHMKNRTDGGITLDITADDDVCGRTNIGNAYVHKCEPEEAKGQLFSLALAAQMSNRRPDLLVVCHNDTAFIREISLPR